MFGFTPTPRIIGAWLRARPHLALAFLALPAVVVVRVVRLGGVWQPDGLPLGWDLTSFLTGARLVGSGDAARLYDFAAQGQVALAHYPGSYSPFPFISPPFVAVLLRPLLSLPYPLALAIWSAAGVVATLLTVRSLVERPIAAPVALVWTSVPFVYALLSGQPTLFSFAIVAFVYRAIERRRLVAAGALAALLLMKPQAMLGLFLYFAIRTRGRAWIGLWVGLLVAAASLVAAGFVAGPEASRQYAALVVHVLPHFLSAARFDPAQVLSWRSFFTLLLGGETPVGEALALLCVLTGVTACVSRWIARKAWAPVSERAAALDFSAAVVLGVFCAPHGSVYDWTVLAVPLLLAWRHCPERRDELVLVVVVLAITTLAAQPVAEAIRLQLALPVLGVLAYFSHRVLDAKAVAASR
jgi:hypothetical protein